MLLACSDGCRAMCFALQVVACCCMAESSDLVRGLAKPFLPEKPFNTNFISRKCQSSINSAQNYDVKRVIAVSFLSYFLWTASKNIEFIRILYRRQFIKT